MDTFEIINSLGEPVDSARSFVEALHVVTFKNRSNPAEGPFTCRPVVEQPAQTKKGKNRSYRLLPFLRTH